MARDVTGGARGREDSFRSGPTELQTELGQYDLPTLLHKLSTQPGREVLRVRSDGREGLVYVDGGQVVHAVAPGVMGEQAALAMLGWEASEAVSCQRSWPLMRSVHASTANLLARAGVSPVERELLVDAEEQSAVKLRTRATDTWRQEPERPSQPSSSRAMRASVRVGPNGELKSFAGELEAFGDLVAYVARLGTVMAAELGLESFESLHAELHGEQLMVFSDGTDIVGLLLRAGATADELRAQLGH